MLVFIISLACFLKLTHIIPLEALVVGPGSGVVDRGGVLENGGAWRSGTEAGHLFT